MMQRVETAETPPRRIIYVARGRMGHDDRGPLPAGHALSWSAINAGTVLAGEPYPYPVYQW